MDEVTVVIRRVLDQAGADTVLDARSLGGPLLRVPLIPHVGGGQTEAWRREVATREGGRPRRPLPLDGACLGVLRQIPRPRDESPPGSREMRLEVR